MEKKFTQGEWIYQFNGNYFDVRRSESISPNIAIFPISRKVHPFMDEIHLCEKDEAEANAKLISAAPDLLEALIKAQARINSLQTYFTASNFTDRYGDADANAECLLVIVDAIKKATT